MLHEIVETKKQHIARLHSVGTDVFRKRAENAPAVRSMKDSLMKSSRPVSVIAEIKKASPSKGLIRTDFRPREIASAYEQAGVEAISVLTDAPYFQGKNDDLTDVRQQVSCPVLRKDFMIEPVQIDESRAIGADGVLLIAAILTDERLFELHQRAHEHGMETLIEVHTEEELQRVCKGVSNPDLIGINNRDLHTFQTSVETTRRLIDHVPKEAVVVSESGIGKPETVRELASMGVRSVLVGEHFMRQPDVSEAVRHLMNSIPVSGEER